MSHEPRTVELDCHCGETLHIPVTGVDARNVIDVDHDWLATHFATHIENQKPA